MIQNLISNIQASNLGKKIELDKLKASNRVNFESMHDISIAKDDEILEI